MKTLYDGTQVPARAWYFLLDYISEVGKENITVFQNDDQLYRVADLSHSQFWALFAEASIKDREKYQIK